MTSLFLLIACSETFVASTASTAPDAETGDLPTETAGTDERTPTSASAVSLEVEVQSEPGRTLEILPYRDGDTFWEGPAMVSEQVDSTTWTVTLPTRPRGAVLEGTGDRVVYAIISRETTDGGTGAITGIADTRLVWTAEGTTGWSLVLDIDTQDEVSFEVNNGSVLYDNILGPTELSLGGFNNVNLPGHHLSLSYCAEAVCTSAFDTPLGPNEWSADLDGAPGIAVVGQPGVADGVVLDISSYFDEAGDNARTVEPTSGTACLGPDRVVASWFSEAHDLAAALDLLDMGVRSGWQASIVTVDGMLGLQGNVATDLAINAACSNAAE